MNSIRYSLAIITAAALLLSGVQATAAEELSPKIGPFLRKERRTAAETPRTRLKSLPEPVDVILVLHHDPLGQLSEATLSTIRSRIASIGGQTGDHAYNKIEARIPLSRIDEIAGWEDIRLIKKPLTPGTFSVPSEGTAVMNTDPWRSEGFTGAGVNVGVIDIGFSGYTRLLGTELPERVTTRATSAKEFESHPHGTACAEILHDTAPAAEMYLANAGNWDIDFHNAVRWLTDQEVAVISSSIGINYNRISALMYQIFRGHSFSAYYASLQLRELDELRTQWETTINEAVSRGVTWVQAAGNDGRNRWKSPFTDTDGDRYLNFTDTENSNEILLPPYFSYGIPVYLVLAWGEETSADDYDLYIVDEDGFLIDRSTMDQNAHPDHPFEVCGFNPIPGRRYFAQIHNYDAEPQVVSLTIGVDGFASFRHFFPTGTVKMGPPADLPGVITVGAVDFTRPYEIASYSSQGPNADDIIKPDVVAPAGVSTRTYGTGGFRGTSAAAPHVAGVCALIRQHVPDATPAEVRDILTAITLDLGVPGKDNIYGSGLVMLPMLSPVCTTVTEDLDLPLRVNYMGTIFDVTLISTPAPSDPEHLYWRLDPATSKETTAVTDDVIHVGADLDIDICADYQGDRYTFTLESHTSPDDPQGLYWKLDPETLEW